MSGTGVVALQALDLRKRYGGGRWGASGMTASVPQGAICALVGPNGAGKSTLLKTFVGFERPTSGSVRVLGIDPWHDRAGALDNIGYVPQRPALYRDVSVLDHLRYCLHVRRGFDLAAAAGYLEDLAIPLSARASMLSGGQQAQVMLAIALSTRARVMILDEPLASLDPLARSEFLLLLTTAIRATDSTALLASHIVTDIAQACDHLIVVGAGRVLLDASLEVVLDRHELVAFADLGPDAAALVGSFASDGGERVSLIRAPDGFADRVPPTGRKATLDEIVKGYLAAARLPRSDRTR